MDSAYLSQVSGIDKPKDNALATYSSKSSVRRRASMFDPIDPTELQKTLYQNYNNVFNSFINQINIGL